jgi:hypothetical protein
MNKCFPRRLAASLIVGCSILTLADRAAADSWKFAVMGDCRGVNSGEGSKDGVRVAVLGPMAADAARQKVSLVIFTGDLINGGASCGPLSTQLAAWKEAMAPLYDAGIPVYPCRGNHETHQGESSGAAVKAWRSFFPDLPQNGPPAQEGLTYRIEHANATFIGFDQFAGQKSMGSGLTLEIPLPKTGMISPWVIEQVKAAKTQWVIAFGHEMAFPGHHIDCLTDARSERDALWDALGEKGGVYLSGHDHLYVRRSAPDSARRPALELVVGCGGAPPYPYDHAPKNDGTEQPYIPTDLFVNSSVNPEAAGASRAKKNTDGLPGYFGYVIVTIDGAKMTGEWRALTNYDREKWRMEGGPKFEALDTFTWPAK